MCCDDCFLELPEAVLIFKGVISGIEFCIKATYQTRSALGFDDKNSIQSWEMLVHAVTAACLAYLP